jgi:hypothetical protein
MMGRSRATVKEVPMAKELRSELEAKVQAANRTV